MPSHVDRRLAAAVLAGWCSLAGVGAARAQITFSNVVDTNTAIPGGTGNFTAFSAYSGSGGRVAFSNGSVLVPGSSSIYLATVGSTDISIQVSDASGSAGTSSPANPVLGGNIFTYQYVYQPDPSSVQQFETGVTDLNAAGHVNGGPLVDAAVIPAISGLSVAFEKTAYAPGSSNPPTPTGYGIYTVTLGTNGGANVTNTIADTRTTVVPEGGGSLTSIGAKVAVSGDIVAFTGFYSHGDGLDLDSGGQGIYTATMGVAGVNPVVDLTTPVPGQSGGFIALGTPSISGNTLAFAGLYDGGESFFTATVGTAGLNPVADLTTPVPGHEGLMFNRLDQILISGNNLVFGGAYSGGGGLFVMRGGTITGVLGIGDALFGSTVMSLDTNLFSFDANAVTFLYTLANGVNGIAVADLGSAPVPGVPVVSVVVVGDGQAVEGSEVGRAFVERMGDTTAALAVRYKVVGSAKPGVDYKPVTGLAVIPAGASRVGVKIKPIDRDTAGSTRLAKIKLLPSTNGSYILGIAKVAKIRIVGND